MPLRVITIGFGDGFPSVITSGLGGEIVPIGVVVELFRHSSDFDFQFESNSKFDIEFSRDSSFGTVFSAMSRINLELFED